MNKIQDGFTLIELMIVIAIIGILATISMPAYQDYITKTRMVEALEMAIPLKKEITEYYAYHGKMPKNNASLFIDKAELLQSKYVKSMTVEDGAIHIALEIPYYVFGITTPQEMILSMRPAIAKQNAANALTADYIFWVSGECAAEIARKSTVLKNRHILGNNKTTLHDTKYYAC